MIERASELRDLVGLVVRLRDGIGVLSVTIGIEPGAASGGTPGWEIALHDDLERLAHDGAAGRAIERRLAGAAGARLADLLDPTSSGRGRALYVALESGDSSEVALQQALPTGARVGPVAHVLPLLAALETGEPSGFVTASRDAISVSETELGIVRDVDRIDLEPSVGDWWPEMKGPARANPLRGQHAVAQRDRHARRVAAAYRRTLDEASDELGSFCRIRGWSRAVVAGDPRRIKVLEATLREHGLATTTIEANLTGLRTEDAVRRLESALASLVTRQRGQLAEKVLTAANGVCGLVPVLAMLAEARVNHLLIDANRTFPGLVGPGESLSAAGHGEGATDLTDLIVARALATDAAVTPLAGDAAKALAVSDGIAALLRW